MSIAIPSTMKAAQVVKAKAPYKIVDISVPKDLTPHQILLRTVVAGYCHTDIMVREGDMPGKLPVTGSHEPSGIIVALGSRVKASQFKIGDRVAAMAHLQGSCDHCEDCELFCKKCKFCKKDQGCRTLTGFSGISADGAFAEYVVVDSRVAVVLPDHLPFAAAASLTCAGITIYSALKKAAVAAGPNGLVGIVGLGALGHIGCQIGKFLNIRIVGVDARQEPLDLAAALKNAPDLIINFKDGLDSALANIAPHSTNPDEPGLDAVIVATDVIASFPFSTKLLRRSGTLFVVGQPLEPIPFAFQDFVFQDLTVKGSNLGTQKELAELIVLAADKGVEVKTQTYKFADMTSMVHDQHQPGAKGKFVMEF